MSQEAVGPAVAEPDQKTEQRRQVAKDEKARRQPPYNVILWNDDDHTHQYVIEMLKALFGYPPEKGFQLAEEVDKTGRAVVFTTTREHAELKRDQIHAYGKDRLCSDSKGSMSATIEPVE
jgi:ATP-dependent Clp protease adaptor protein ClpS